MDKTISAALKKKIKEKFKKSSCNAGYIGSSVSYDLIKDVKLQ